MKNLIQVELQKLELQIKWVTNMINEAENQGDYRYPWMQIRSLMMCWLL